MSGECVGGLVIVIVGIERGKVQVCHGASQELLIEETKIGV
jgi:hypothetical protein